MTVNYDKIKEDLYLAVNENWLEEAVIPDDKPSTGGFITLRDGIEELLMKDTKEMAAGQLELTNAEQEQFVKYYQQAMDFEKRNQLAGEPLKGFLDRILALGSLSDLQSLAPEWVLKGLALPFSLMISSDMKNTDVYALYMDVASTILPDTTYYAEGNPAAEQLLAVYQAMSTQVLTMQGYDEAFANELVEKALAFDRAIVPHVMSAEELADYTIIYNPRPIDEVEAYLDAFSFKQLFNELTHQEVDKVIVTQPKYFEALKDLLSADNFENLKAWMLVKTANGATSLLSEDLRQAGAQYGLALSGSPKAQDATKAAYYTAIGMYDQVIGNYYGQKYFGPEAREDVREMVVQMIEVYKERLENNDWLSQVTIEKAIVKLDAIDILIGYPDDYPEIYTKLIVDENKSFFENTLDLAALQAQDEFDRWNGPVDRKRWGMSANTVNAYYNPSANLICFPAAILQAPFYSLDQSRSENYGGIGAVIAHEISHAFDNNGAKFDERGNLNDWWTQEDLQQFDNKAQAMIELWDGIEIHGGKVNGKLTVSENIADSGGLTAAIQAAKLEADADLPALFMNWARIWCQKARDQYLSLLLAIDVHSPNPLRANMTPRSMDEFYQAFDIQPNDPMYLPENQRVIIW